MRVSPPTLVGGILAVFAIVFTPLAYFSLNIYSLYNYYFYVGPFFSLGYFDLYLGYYTLYLLPILFYIPMLAGLVGGILGIVGGATQKKGLKIAGGVLGLVAGILALVLIYLYDAILTSSLISIGLGYVDFFVSISASYGTYLLIAGGALCLIGLAVKDD